MALQHRPDFILSPNVAWVSDEAVQALADQLIDSIEAFERSTLAHVVLGEVECGMPPSRLWIGHVGLGEAESIAAELRQLEELHGPGTVHIVVTSSWSRWRARAGGGARTSHQESTRRA